MDIVAIGWYTMCQHLCSNIVASLFVLLNSVLLCEASLKSMQAVGRTCRLLEEQAGCALANACVTDALYSKLWGLHLAC